MKRLQIRGFILRFILCLIVLSAALFSIQQARDNQSNVVSPDKQLVDVRSKLSELLLRSVALAEYDDSDPVASQTMARLTTELGNTNLDLQRQSKLATLLTTEQGKTIESIGGLQATALKQYRTSYEVLGQVIEYNPETDLGLVDPKQNTELLTNRTLAAKNGLLKAGGSSITSAASGLAVSDQDGAPLIVSDATRSVLQAQASCFDQLANQVQTNAAEATKTRQKCIDSYPATRRQAVTNVMQSSFSPDYTKRLKNLVSPLIDELQPKPDK